MAWVLHGAISQECRFLQGTIQTVYPTCIIYTVSWEAAMTQAGGLMTTVAVPCHSEFSIV